MEMAFSEVHRLLAEVEVHRNRNAVTLGSLTGFLGDFSGLVADGGRDAAPVEPLGSFHDGIEVELAGVGLGDGRVGTVVDDLAGTHGGAGLGIVQSYAVAATHDITCVNTIATQGIDGNLSNFVGG